MVWLLRRPDYIHITSSSIFCFASSIFRLVPINLISLLSSSETRRRKTKTEEKKNLIYVLVYVEHVRSFLLPSLLLLMVFFSSFFRFYHPSMYIIFGVVKAKERHTTFYSKITGTCRMRIQPNIKQKWRRSNLIVNRWSFWKLETNRQTT